MTKNPLLPDAIKTFPASLHENQLSVAKLNLVINYYHKSMLQIKEKDRGKVFRKRDASLKVQGRRTHFKGEEMIFTRDLLNLPLGCPPNNWGKKKVDKLTKFKLWAKEKREICKQVMTKREYIEEEERDEIGKRIHRRCQALDKNGSSLLLHPAARSSMKILRTIPYPYWRWFS